MGARQEFWHHHINTLLRGLPISFSTSFACSLFGFRMPLGSGNRPGVAPPSGWRPPWRCGLHPNLPREIRVGHAVTAQSWQGTWVETQTLSPFAMTAKALADVSPVEFRGWGGLLPHDRVQHRGRPIWKAGPEYQPSSQQFCIPGRRLAQNGLKTEEPDSCWCCSRNTFCVPGPGGEEWLERGRGEEPLVVSVPCVSVQT